MPVQHIHTYLVHPGKGKAAAIQINGAQLKLAGKLFELLSAVYAKSDEECDIDITFVPAGGKQQNDCRDLICSYLAKPTLSSGRKIAERLANNTDGRSGLGLLFLIAGKEGREHKLVVSRFPTDNAIYVDENPQNLTVQFLERVFMKNKASYKAVNYKDVSVQAGLWSGRAIDKQINSPAGELSNYWIVDFLASQFTVTSARGTRRLASALREAAKRSDLGIRHEIVSVATLAVGFGGRSTSIDEFMKHFNLSVEARTAIAAELSSPRLAQEQFKFDLPEFQSLVAFKSVELSNGAILTAPASDFDHVFESEVVDRARRQTRFTTEGTITNERLKSTA